ncbi:GTPase domain-containing protein [Streptomyces polygonati]|uniref:GTPase domain-containing protein n=1 Tax=Streptomyces polygonati TaxID=1617087 RepID=A0ABV8HU71_9ACTN
MNEQDEAVTTILGEDAAAPEPSAGPRPRVVFFGSYDSGKSSAIRRLLTEDGTKVPSWLTVGAQPETFEENAVVSDGLILVDTPGTAAGSAWHDETARAALAAADMVLLFLGPQRTAEDRTQLSTLVDLGFTSRTVLVVMARCDSVGDPELAPAEFRAALADRTAVLRGLLPGPLAEAGILPVAADPFGVTADSGVPGPAAYDPYRSWDGVAELRRRLNALPGRLAELRKEAAGRARLALLERARVHAADEIATAEKIISEAELRKKQAALVRPRLDKLDAAAAQALHTAIGRELDAVVGLASGMDAGEVRSTAETRLKAALTAWDGTWNGRLSELAGEVAEDLVAESVRPSSVAFDAWADGLLADAGGSGDAAQSAGRFAPPSAEKLSGVAGGLKSAVRGGVKLWLSPDADMETTLAAAKSAASARENVKESFRQGWERLRGQTPFAGLDASDDDFVRYVHKGAVDLLESEREEGLAKALADAGYFKTFKDVDRAKRWLGNLDVVAEFVPVALSLGGFLGGLLAEKRAATADRERRARDKAKVTALTAEYTDSVLGDPHAPAEGTWRYAVARLRGLLTEDPLLDPAVAAARARAEELQEAVRLLQV